MGCHTWYKIEYSVLVSRMSVSPYLCGDLLARKLVLSPNRNEIFYHNKKTQFCNVYLFFTI